MPTWLAIAMAGALGSLSRYSVGLAAQSLLGPRFAWGTLIVNVLGSFLLGVLLTFGLESSALPKTLRIAITTGFLGAFTTFSTFSYESMSYLQKGDHRLAALNIGANLSLGFLAVVTGIAMGRAMSLRYG